MAKRKKIYLYYWRQKCSPMTGFRKCKAYAEMHWDSPGRGHQMAVGLSTTVIFGDLGGYFFGNIRDKANNIIWRYATTPCWQAIDCKMNDLQ